MGRLITIFTFIVMIDISCLLIAADETPSITTKHALLIGCTRYPSPVKQLDGPENDVVLVRRLLLEKFHFQPDAIVTLAEHLGKDSSLLPTRANIVKQFERLIGVVKPGDQVVILLAGHGSQQPDNDPDDGDDDELDGFDETFWPSDVGIWDKAAKVVANAIVDDEIRRWLSEIRDAGAFVFFVADSCCSGTLTRGNGSEVSRHVDPVGVVPGDELDRARRAAERRSTGNRRIEGNDLPNDRAGIVALYAAQPNEEEIEMPLPRHADNQKVYGLLTHTITEVLLQAKSPLTYRELVYSVHQQYIQMERRTYPTPLLEGTNLDREILGQKDWPERPSYVLTREATTLSLNAGALHGLTKGSILAVFPPAGAIDAERSLGHVRIETVRSLNCKVVPCEFSGSPIPENLPDGARAKVVYQDFGDLRLRVAVDDRDIDDRPLSKERGELLVKTLTNMSKARGSFILYEHDISKSDWLVRSGANEVFLVPASGHPRSRPRSIGANARSPMEVPSPLYGPGKIDESLPDWLESRLQRIARVSNLHRIVGKDAENGEETDDRINITVEVEQVPESGVEPTVVGTEGGVRVVHEDDVVRFRVHNRGSVPVDVTLLFVDADYGIRAWLPRRGKADTNRIDPHKSLPSIELEVTAASELEHVIAIAVRADPQSPRSEFTCLEQKSLERTRSGPRSGDDPLDSPLGKLLQNAMFAEGQTRGARPAEIGRYAVRRISWRVDPPSPDK